MQLQLSPEMVPRPLEPCEPVYRVVECACGRSVKKDGCNRLDCPSCQKHLGARRGASVLKKLENRPSGRAVCYTVLTFPESVRERFAVRSDFDLARKNAWRLLKEIGADWAFCAVHPVGEDGRTFHPHLNFLWVPRDGFRPFIDVEWLRVQWSFVLGVDVSVVYHQFSGHFGKVQHWARYVSRTFPGWHWWTGPVRWYGHYPKVQRKPCPCPKCGEYPRYVGTIPVSECRFWEEEGFLLGLPPPWERASFGVRENAGSCQHD